MLLKGYFYVSMNSPKPLLWLIIASLRRWQSGLMHLAVDQADLSFAGSNPARRTREIYEARIFACYNIFMRTRRVAAILLTSVILVAPFALQAAGMPAQIVPCAGAKAAGNLPACNICHLANLAQNLINTGIFVAVFLSAILFAYAGWLYVSNEAIGKVQDAKNLFLDVVLGLVLVLGAWMLVDTLMHALLGGGFGPWNSVCA